MEQLFQTTDKNLSVFDLPKMEERQRKTAISKAEKRLNDTLTREWQKFRLDEREALEISIDLYQEPGDSATAAYYLTLDIVERNPEGNDHYFFISDRSKGFYWFFNFVMKLEFNPKTLSTTDRRAIYLLDEPGSYLHASAQSRLCGKLKSLSSNSSVIYCTHSHYLLNPEIIPFSSIHVADRDEKGEVSLTGIHDHQRGLYGHGAFQPVLDALQVKPFALDGTYRRVIIVEGIFDFYCLDLFRQDPSIGIVPAVGADSVKRLISLMIGWRQEFAALWDADAEGRKAYEQARDSFGPELEARLRLLPCAAGKTRIMQNLISGDDMRMFRSELALPANSGFRRTIAAVYYGEQKAAVMSKVSDRTRDNFQSLYEALSS